MTYSLFLARLGFSASVRMRAWKKIAAQTRHGLSLEFSLRQMQQRAEAKHSPTTAVFTHILKHLGFGHNLGACLVGYASPEETMLISSGQRSGHLPEGLELAAALLSARRTILRAVTSALAYPAFLLAMCLLMLFVVSVVVMPKFAMLSDPSKWSGMASILYAATSFVTSPLGVAVLLLFLVCLITSLVTLPMWTGRFRLYVENVPPWSIYRLTVGCVWLYTVSTLMRSGLQLSNILDSMLNSEDASSYLRERISAISIEIGRGNNLGEALYNSGMNFPASEMIDDLRVFAALPGFHNRIHELAGEWMSDGVDLVKQQARIINILAIILLTGIISLVASAIGSLQSQLLPSGGF